MTSARERGGRAAESAILRVVPRSGEGELVVEVEGRGPPVVLIHGWAVDRRMWAHQRFAFRRHFTTVTYDRRACGQSTAPADFSMEIDDLEVILNALQLPEVGLVGMSQGGRIALRYSMRHQRRVSGLVLQGAPLDHPEPAPGDASILPLRRYAYLLGNGDRETLLRELGTHALMDPGARFAQARAEVAAMLGDYRGEDLLNGKPPATAVEPVFAADLAGIEAPTLVITGSQELMWLKGAADRMARNIRGARRRVIRGGGHFVNMTHARHYNACVIEFLLSTTRPWSERALGNV